MEREIFFILDEHGNPVPEPDPLKWGEWMRHNKLVRRDKVGSYTVSTIFLGFVSAFFTGDRPELFDTMVLGDDDDMMRRYATKQEALKGHLEVLYQVKRKVRRAA